MNDFVRKGYERIAERYEEERHQFITLPYLERFTAMLPAGGRVFDIGCGTGIPAARFLLDHGFSVTGIDIASRMIELARANVPSARFEVRDMLSLKPTEYEVDGIVVLYSIFHVHREEHQRLLQVLRSYLPSGGGILITMGAEEWEGSEPDFLGTEMFWSHYGPEQNRAMLEQAGFRIELDAIDTSGRERHQMLIGQAITPR